MEAEYLFLQHILGVADHDRWRKIANHIERRQGPDGGWALYHGAPADLSTTIECYLALKMAGRPGGSPVMRRARDLVVAKGGIEKARVFTKIWLAMLGQWDWKGTPYLLPELILLPGPLPLNIYSFSSWTRATVVPMTVILSQRPTVPLPEGCGIDELYVRGRAAADYSLPSPKGFGWERIFHATDRILHTTEKLPWNPLRRRALREVEEWIVSHQEADGSWGGIQPPWVYSLIALKQLGHPAGSGVIKKGMDGFEGFAIEESDTWRLQACVSPLWDTCLTINALLDSGVSPSHPAIVRASDWLIARQILRPGDWAVKVRGAEPGGWAFEFDNELYPDTDDAAEILLAIGRAGASDAKARDAAVERGMRWVLSMQSRNGGWGSFDKDNTSLLATKLPFFDFGETIDPPSVDVTAHILEAIGALGYPVKMPAVERALKYIWSEQESDGPWFGRWGVNYLYGTGAVLPALSAVGFDMRDGRVQNAADWVESRQNPDGGWGETCASYADPRLRGRGGSTPSQTAWALLALVAAGRGRGEAAGRGAEYLVRMQRPDGQWEEADYTATGFPGYGIGDRKFKAPHADEEDIIPDEMPAAFMIKYHMYRLYWPLLALGRFRASAGVPAE
jgi:squalene-hopene/tetraprenyl-beta-curcumene cyclase